MYHRGRAHWYSALSESMSITGRKGHQGECKRSASTSHARACVQRAAEARRPRAKVGVA